MHQGPKILKNWASCSNAFPIAIGIIVICSLAVLVWAASQWSANFDSDEAIIGLMASHILRGQIPVYYYGQAYLGSAGAVLSAVFIKFLGHNPFALRIPHIMLYGIFLVLQALWLRRIWNWRVALLSTMLTGLPGQYIFFYIYKPNIFASMIFVIGTSFLMLASLNLYGIVSLTRWAGMGILAGLGVWTHPLVLIYLFAWIVPTILISPEWEKVIAKVDKLLGHRSNLYRELVPIAAILVCVGGFFSNGCYPSYIFERIKLVSLTILGAAAFLMFTLLVGFSYRRALLIAQSGLFLAGALLGSFPMWKVWLLDGLPPSAISPSCPDGIPHRVILILRDMLPIVVGSSTLSWLTKLPPLQAALKAAVLIVGGLFVIQFIWKRRYLVKMLWLLNPLTNVPPSRITEIYLLLLFATSLFLGTLAGNVVDTLSFRYLLIGWQAISVMSAITMSEWWEHHYRRVVVVILLGLWLWQIYLGGLLEAFQKWQKRNSLYAPQAVNCLENYMATNHIRGGYGDYWLAYALDFLAYERLIFSPYNGIVRYPPYAETVDNLPVYAYITWHGSPILLPVQNQKHIRLDRRQVCNWDVWVMSRLITLQDGWSTWEDWGIWAEGTHSTASWIAAEKREYVLRVGVFPHCVPDQRQQISVMVNGEKIGSYQWQECELWEAEIPIQGSVVRVGWNEIAFQYAYARSPAEVTHGQNLDPRVLSVGFTVLEVK